MTETQKHDQFKEGERVAEWGSYRVGTIIGGWETSSLCSILWDIPRLKRKFDPDAPHYSWRSIEFQSLLPIERVYDASEYQEMWNRHHVKQIETYPRKKCPYCEDNEGIIYVDKEHIGHCGTPLIYIYGCPKCLKAYAVHENGEYYGQE